MMKIVELAVAAGLLLFVAEGARAGLAPTYPLGVTAGTWEVDRYPPSVFNNSGTLLGRQNVLDLGLSSADSLANRPPAFSSTFYNTQGRGLPLDQGAYAVIYGSVYLPSAWAASSGPSTYRRSDMWGVLSPASGGDTCPGSNCNLFPIIDFSNADPGYPASTGAATGRYRVFDTNVGFVDLATPVAYDQWSDLCIAWTGTDIRHYVNGTQVYVQSNLAQADTSFGPPDKYTRMINQGYNFGSSYDINWSGIGAGTVTSTTVSGAGQITPPGSAFAQAISLVVLDAGGAPIPCVPVTFTAPGTGASATLSATTVLTDRTGTASSTATANSTLGTFSISAQAAGIALPTPITLTNGFPAVAAAPVPTLSLTGLLALGLLLTTVAMGNSARPR
jgi:hypothetical protein